MKNIYLSVDPKFQTLWFLSGLSWKRVAVNKEAIEPMVHIGQFEVLRSPP